MNRKSGLTAENTMPKPKEFPKKPSVITMMFVRVRGGFRSAVATCTAVAGLTLPVLVVVVVTKLLAECETGHKIC